MAPTAGGAAAGDGEREVSILGAEGPHARRVNGIFYSQPSPDEPLVYCKRGDDSVWLFRDKDGAWIVGSTSAAAACWAPPGASDCWARSSADPMKERPALPPTRAGGWQVLGKGGVWKPQRLLVVKGRLDVCAHTSFVPVGGQSFVQDDDSEEEEEDEARVPLPTPAAPVAPPQPAARSASPRSRGQTFDFDVLEAKEASKEKEVQGHTFDFDLLDEADEMDTSLLGVWCVEGKKQNVYEIKRTEEGSLCFEQRVGAAMTRLRGILKNQHPWFEADLECRHKSVGQVRVRFLKDNRGRLLSNFRPSTQDWGGDTFASRLPQPYLVDNRQLRAETLGVGYRTEKSLEAKSPDNACASWGSVVMGVEDGDGWLRAGKRFLPTDLQGVRVLNPTKLAYVFRPQNGKAREILAEPRIDGTKTGKLLAAGTGFLVSAELVGRDAIPFLRLADGKGWVPMRDPDFGTICFRNGADAALGRSAVGDDCDSEEEEEGAQPSQQAGAAPRNFALVPNGGIGFVWDPSIDLSMAFQMPSAPQQLGNEAAGQTGEDFGPPEEVPEPGPDFFPFRDDGELGDEGWERDNVCRAISLLYCEWILGRTPATRPVDGKRFLHGPTQEVDPLPTARNFYMSVFRPFYVKDDMPRPQGPNTPWLQRVYAATDPDVVREDFVQTPDLPGIKIRQVVDCQKDQSWQSYFKVSGSLGTELLSKQRSGCFCLSYFQLSVNSLESNRQLDGRAHCIAIVTKSLPDRHLYLCDPDLGVYRFKGVEELLEFLSVELKAKATHHSGGGTTGVSRLRLIEVVPAYFNATRQVEQA